MLRFTLNTDTEHISRVDLLSVGSRNAPHAFRQTAAGATLTYNTATSQTAIAATPLYLEYVGTPAETHPAKDQFIVPHKCLICALHLWGDLIQPCAAYD